MMLESKPQCHLFLCVYNTSSRGVLTFFPNILSNGLFVIVPTYVLVLPYV